MTFPIDVADHDQVEAAASSVELPVPPIYQPEVAADAIHHAAHHKRRQIYVLLDPQGHDNLFEAVEEDRGAHGPFDDKAHAISPRYEPAKRRGLFLVGLGAAAAGAGAAAIRAGR